MEILKRVDQVATGFQSLGVAAGDGVAICIRNEVTYYEGVTGCGRRRAAGAHS